MSILRTLACAVLLASGIATAHAEPFAPLNSPSTVEVHPGKFVWADLFTSDPTTATKFYCDLLGWTSATLEQKGKNYTVFSNAGHPVAGLAPHSPAKANRPSRWVGYVSVADINKVVSLVTRAGGIVHAPARNFPNRGYQAIIGDPEGVPIGLLQSTSGDSPDGEPATGDWNWFELYEKNPTLAANFCRDALGVEVSEDVRSQTKNEYLLSSNGDNRGGITQMPEGDDVHSTWLGVIRVADLDATLAKVPGLGGEVLVPPRPVELGSRFAIVMDPTGGTFGLVQYAENENPANGKNP